MSGATRTRGYWPLLWLGLAMLAVALLHAMLGARPLPPATVLWAVLDPDPADFTHQIVLHFRLPRLLAAVIAGSGLALCGALLQALVRNPLAEPQLLGLNAGAALAVVLSAALLPASLAVARPVLAAGGALLLFGGVLLLSSAGRGGPTPQKLILCGVALSALASAITAATLLLDEQALEDLRLWLAGDLAGQGLGRIWPVLPFHLGAVAVAFVLAPQLSLLALGDEVAQGLGVRLHRLRLAALVTAALLCGAAVTLAGPIGFIGLLVPQLLRRVLDGALWQLLLGCVLGGPLLLLAADIIARTAFLPQEIATGVITGALGAPVFIAIILRHRA
jgi:iron complex transport system permease protein